jgi:cytochrome c
MRLHDLGLAMALGASLLAASAVYADTFGNPPTSGFGQPISEADLALWDIDIQTPTGKGLPEGQGTVAHGKEVFAERCAACHGKNAEGGPMYGTMVGGIGTMDQNPRVLTPGSMYPYGPILFDYVRRAMPLDAPQSLTAEETYSVVAYIYQLNGLLPADATIDGKTLAAMKMPNRDAFIVDDRPDTKAERCMTDCKPIGTVADGQRK